MSSPISPSTAKFRFALILALPFFLGGCGAIYDATKGWGRGIAQAFENFPNNQQQPANQPAAGQPQSAEIPPALEEEEITIPDASVSAEETEIASTPAPTDDTGKSETAAATETAQEAKAEPSETMQTVMGSYAIHLASNKSRKSAEREWSEIQGVFPKETGNLKLEIRRVEIPNQGTFYRVLGTPFATKEEAQKICGQLKAKRQYCAVKKL